MDPRYQPQGAVGHPAGPWAPQPGGGYGPGPVPGRADDALVRLGGWIVGLLAIGVLATVALVAGEWPPVATWRRWRWWPLALTGLAGLLLVLAVSGPTGAVDSHLLALRELTDSAGRPLGTVVGERWPAWVLAQLPLSLPLGLLLAALGRHQDAHVAAHESHWMLPPSSRKRPRSWWRCRPGPW